jgi:predicted SAM-dependent methyltransferase
VFFIIKDNKVVLKLFKKEYRYGSFGNHLYLALIKTMIKTLIKRLMPSKYLVLLIDTYRFFFSFLYWGNKFECPICLGHYRKFLPVGYDIPVIEEKRIVGGGYRLNAICPRCYSFDRERLIYLYLVNHTDFFNRNVEVLHIAPEKNIQKKFIAGKNISYLSADLDSPLAMIKMDITDINHERDYFDLIICNHVLEHINEDHKAMSELYRILRPGGKAILQVPISLSLDETFEDPTVKSPEEREKVFGQKNHVRIYAKDYKDRLEKVGFTVEVYDVLKEFGELNILKYGLLKDENIYICSKLNH